MCPTGITTGTETVAESLGLACALAFTVNVPGSAGAVYVPSCAMLPPSPSTIDQRILWLVVLLTVALKTRESPVCITLDAPVMVTTTAGSGGGGSGAEPPPPQPARYHNPTRPL